MTIRHDSYMSAAPDMSGSIAKNRFRNELLWGIEKLLDCLDKGIDDFAVVFDYRCDIELHLCDGYEFYQVKTGTGEKFSVSWACKKRGRSGVPIIGRLYELHDISADGSVRLVIVGNKPFSNKNGTLEDPGELLFATLHDDDKRKVVAAIEEHLPDVSPDISNISYLMVAMDLAHPDDSASGHLMRTYESIMKCEPRKPNALYRALRSLVESKACEEKRQATYDDVIEKKAITQYELNRLFDAYADKENSQHDFVMSWVRSQPPLQQHDLRCAYETVIQNLYQSRGHEPLRIAIEVAMRLDNSLQIDEVVEQIAESIKPECGIEITQAMRMVYAVIALHEVMEKGLR